VHFDPQEVLTSPDSTTAKTHITTTPPPGGIKYSANAKNAVVTWFGKDSTGRLRFNSKSFATVPTMRSSRSVGTAVASALRSRFPT
jgi:hypothetical protein